MGEADDLVLQADHAMSTDLEPEETQCPVCGRWIHMSRTEGRWEETVSWVGDATFKLDAYEPGETISISVERRRTFQPHLCPTFGNANVGQWSRNG